MPRRSLRAFWQRPHSQAELNAHVREEIATHVAMSVEYLMARGVPREQAEADARARFGDLDGSLRRLYSTARQRESRINRKERFDDLRQDVRLAWRLFQRSPVFFGAALATLAIGIGANGAVFSVLQAALLQPLPYRSPGELVMLWRNYPNRPPAKGKTRPELVRGGLTAPMLLDWRDETARDWGDAAGLVTWRGNTEAQFDHVLSDRTDRLNGALATPNFFDVLGVRAEHGRVFSASDESTNASLLVVSHALWQRDFGGDTAIVGRAVTLIAGRPRQPHTYTVVGVLAPEVHFSYPEPTDAWAMIPWSYVGTYSPRAIAFSGVMRLKPGVSLAQAQRRAELFRTGLDQPDQPPDQRVAVALEPMHEWIVGETRPALLLLGSVAVLLLLVTCVTVANGLLARVSEREQELAVRAALGAGGMRLLRQLLTEGAMLSCAGATAGTVVAVATQPLLRRLLPGSVPQVGAIAFNGPILLFGAVVAVTVTLLAAVAPALSGIRARRTERLYHSANRMSASRHAVRLRQVLVAAQSATATALLISAALLLVSFWKLGQVSLGFDASSIITLETRLLDQKYRDKDEVARVQDALVERVRAVPGVTEVALSSAVPFRGVDFMGAFASASQVVPAASRDPKLPPPGLANVRYVDAGYFGILRIPLRRGRFLAESDRKGAPHVAVISEAFAHDLFGDADPVGQVIKGSDELQVVGVVADVRYASRDKDPWPALYLPRAQNPENLICIMVRTRGHIAGLPAALRKAVSEVDATIPALKLSTMDEIISDSVAGRRFYTVATAAFACIALLLTIAGLFVVVSRAVAERKRELAIRSALGATITRLFRNATIDVVSAAAIGIGAGAFAVYAVSTLLAQFLFGVTSRSPATYGLSAGLVLGVATIAALVPIVRFREVSLAALLKIE